MWTHLEGFKHLSEEEFDLLIDASALVTVLVGASDGELDKEEHLWSEKLMRTRTYSSVKYLNDFYRVAAEGFWVRVQAIMTHYPPTVQARNQAISEKLAVLNEVFRKLEPKMAFHLYKGLCALAEEVAEASGGFLRLGSVNREEAKWVDLSMIDPVEPPADLEIETEEEENPDE